MMRKWMLLLFILLTPLVAGATAVTGTVTDAGSQAWANGTWAIQVVPPPGSGPQPALNQNGTLNGSGVFTATITATSSLTPSGAKWQLTVCPQATAECYISFPVITGTTQSLTVTPPAILVNVQSGPVLLYQDNEFANPTIGQFYYNLTSSVYRFWNGSAWVSITPGGSGTITSCPTSGGVAYENGTANTLTCGTNLTFDSTNKQLDVNNNPTTTAKQGVLTLRGDGAGDCDGFMDPCMAYIQTNDNTPYFLAVQNLSNPTTTTGMQLSYSYNAPNSSFFMGNFRDTTHFTDWTFQDNGYLNLGGMSGTNAGQFEIDSPNDTVTMRKGHPSTIPETMHIQFDASNNILIQPVAGSLTKIGRYGGSNFATFGDNGETTAPTYSTTTNCADSAGAAACGSAAAGHFVIDATTTSTVVSTTAVTASSEIQINRDNSLGTLLTVTCNTQSSLVLGTPRVTARTAGVSFTVSIDVGPTTSPMCIGYTVVN